jgi:hypothetical protein
MLGADAPASIIANWDGIELSLPPMKAKKPCAAQAMAVPTVGTTSSVKAGARVGLYCHCRTACIDAWISSGASGGLNFYTVTPCRLVDTRNTSGPLGGPIISGDSTRSFPLAGSCGLPPFPAAQAYSLNMTVVPQGSLGYLTTWPAGGTQPVVSTLNAPKGQVVANAAIVPSGSSGSTNVFVTDITNVIVDTNGYFGP